MPNEHIRKEFWLILKGWLWVKDLPETSRVLAEKPLPEKTRKIIDALIAMISFFVRCSSPIDGLIAAIIYFTRKNSFNKQKQQ